MGHTAIRRRPPERRRVCPHRHREQPPGGRASGPALVSRRSRGLCGIQLRDHRDAEGDHRLRTRTRAVHHLAGRDLQYLPRRPLSLLHTTHLRRVPERRTDPPSAVARPTFSRTTSIFASRLRSSQPRTSPSVMSSPASRPGGCGARRAPANRSGWSSSRASHSTGVTSGPSVSLQRTRTPSTSTVRAERPWRSSSPTPPNGAATVCVPSVCHCPGPATGWRRGKSASARRSP